MSRIEGDKINRRNGVCSYIAGDSHRSFCVLDVYYFTFIGHLFLLFLRPELGTPCRKNRYSMQEKQAANSQKWQNVGDLVAQPDTGAARQASSCCLIRARAGLWVGSWPTGEVQADVPLLYAALAGWVSPILPLSPVAHCAMTVVAWPTVAWWVPHPCSAATKL